MRGTGSAAQSNAEGPESYARLSYSDTSTTGAIIAQVMDYSATDKHKTFLTRESRTGAAVAAIASRWASTSAVTSLAVIGDGGNFASGCTFSLYGVIA